MFTGLIQTTGYVRQLDATRLLVICNPSRHLQGSSLLADLDLGDSVAVDGVCLTVTELRPDGFVADVSPETLRRTTLEQRLDTIPVNLEPSLRVGSKLGGHFVTGHVDGLGYLAATTQTKTSWEMDFEVVDAHVARYLVPKGSIAINGISLTVADCAADGSRFMVAVIPLTYAETNLSALQLGGCVNLEGDVLGKYVERFMGLGMNQETGAIAAFGGFMAHPSHSKVVDAGFLSEHGYG
ncbi:MAG: riboflavin synthase [Kaiparowitsia implicata GSE-PSE-MK54-09C]|nr:riboflavin synthase [Kaiparowitsia implicata GSE-PSE-MK54-09C]